MKVETGNRNARVEKGIEKLIIPYKELIFIYPASGPNTYINVGNEIESQGLIRPTAEETAYLLHSTYFDSDVKDTIEFKEIKDIIKNRWLWEFTRQLWTPKGVYIYDDRKGKEKDEKHLKDKLGSKEVNHVVYSDDNTLRFVPRQFIRLGDCSPSDLAISPYIQARQSGEEGAEKLADISKIFKNNTRVFGLIVNESTQRVSALYSYWYGDRLSVDGVSFDGGSFGGALGVYN